MYKAVNLALIILIIGSSSIFGQELSEKHKQKLEQVKDPKKRDRLFKKYSKKDSAKFHKKLKHKLSEVGDSLGLPYIPTALDTPSVESIKEAEMLYRSETEAYQKYLPDSLIFDKSKQLLKNKVIGEIEDQTGINVTQVDTSYVESKAHGLIEQKLNKETGISLSDMDSASFEKLENKLVDETENQLMKTEEIQELKSLEGEADISQITDQQETLALSPIELVEQAKKNRLKKQLVDNAKNYVKENIDKIQQAQTKVTNLKKKYSYVPNSNDLSTARKRTSLKGQPLLKRLILGGNFNIEQVEPFKLDLSPVLGYRFNTLFGAGVTFKYRASFNVDNKNITADRDKTYGYGFFIDHMLYLNFFGYIEGERIKNTTIFPNEERERSWKTVFLAGIGRRFMIMKHLEIQAMVLYNFRHQDLENPYKNPVVFKSGLRFRK